MIELSNEFINANMYIVNKVDHGYNKAKAFWEALEIYNLEEEEENALECIFFNR